MQEHAYSGAAESLIWFASTPVHLEQALLAPFKSPATWRSPLNHSVHLGECTHQSGKQRAGCQGRHTLCFPPHFLGAGSWTHQTQQGSRNSLGPVQIAGFLSLSLMPEHLRRVETCGFNPKCKPGSGRSWGPRPGGTPWSPDSHAPHSAIIDAP